MMAQKKQLFTVREMTFTAIFAALLAVCSWITVPLVIPITMQTFAVFAAVLILGPKCSFAALSVWMLLGIAGAPVFAGFKAGISVLSGLTGGYILGFLLCPPIYAVITKTFGRNLPVRASALIIDMFVYYSFGTAWFIVLYTRTGDISVWSALQKCVIPFLPFDIAKLVLALAVESRVGRLVKLDR